MADWGADVIKIEMPAEPSENTKADPLKARHGPDFQNLHRNKRSLTLNLKAPDGLAIFKRLADQADVIIEIIVLTLNTASASIMRHSAPAIRAWSMPVFPASVRTAPMRSARASIKLPKAWAG